ncbi:E3 ubiquitin- ligase TRAF7 [Olea europaea subsp. europaea]|uniref:E3 ubiquitin- ligase TRAF7 n=1 Tax=Olea europaea subsp. europaea TaxID=158383 RepID=A0A8S0SUT1_OLEEU|nr:E3 ubiquitin- ligase TRAF7 [Olea europaea subsp. europaea]
MKVRSWLSTCSSATCITTSGGCATTPSTKPFHSDTSSDVQSLSSSSQETSSSSLQSNLSLLTLPSVPSLQKLSPENLNLSIDTHFLTTLKHCRPVHINFMAVNNNLLYAVSGNGINVFEIINNTLVDTFSGDDISSGAVKSVSFCNGKIFTAHQDCKIRVWKLTIHKKHKLITTLPTLEDRFRKFILPQNYVKVRRHKKKLWIEHHDAVSGLAVYGNSVLSISWDKSLKIWRGSDFRCTESIAAHNDSINAVVVSNDGIIYTGSADKRIKVWGRTQSPEKKIHLIATLEKHKSAVNALALNSAGNILFSGSCDRSILVWEREDSANYMVVTGALRGHSRAILCLITVNDFLFSGSADQTVRIWQRRIDGLYCCLTVVDGHQKPVKSMVAAVAADGGDCGGCVKVFSGSFDGEIKVWQVEVSGVTSSLS